MIQLVWLICLWGGSIAWGLRKLSKKFAQDLINVIIKAHKGHLPAGVYAEQYISAQRLSRNELRLPIDSETLHQMDQCNTIHAYDVSCRVIESKASFKHASILLVVSVQFDGESEERKRIHINLQHSYITAKLTLENHIWYLSEIRSIS